jgi:hypothetical protein
MEQPKQSFRVEFKDSEDGDARIGMLRLSSSRLHFVEDGNASKSFSLELNEVEALRQETETSSTDGSSCTLLLRCTDGRLLRVKAIDSTFLRQLAQEIEKLQSLDDKAMTSAVSSASPGNGSAVFSPEKPRFRFQTIGFTKLISVEVLPPVDVVWGPERSERLIMSRFEKPESWVLVMRLFRFARWCKCRVQLRPSGLCIIAFQTLSVSTPSCASWCWTIWTSCLFRPWFPNRGFLSHPRASFSCLGRASSRDISSRSLLSRNCSSESRKKKNKHKALVLMMFFFCLLQIFGILVVVFK